MVDSRTNPSRYPPVRLRVSDAGLDFIYRHEAQTGVSNHLHWPGGSSGVTLGPGYDMKERSSRSIISDLVGIGVAKSVAQKVSEAAGLVGEKAEDFADDNEDLLSLGRQQETALLRLILPRYEKLVQRNFHTDLTQFEYDALVSFAYNPGGSIHPVAHALAIGKVSHAMKVIEHRIFTGKHASRGLIHRREDEVRLFVHGEYYSHAAPAHHRKRSGNRR